MTAIHEAGDEAMAQTQSDDDEQKRMLEVATPKTFVDRLEYFTWVQTSLHRIIGH